MAQPVRERKTAFTLIELLIVVAIIGILAAVAVPNFLNAQVRAKIARAISDMKALETALESYRLDCNDYPPWTESRVVGYDSSHPNEIRYYRMTTPVASISTLSPLIHLRHGPTSPITTNGVGLMTMSTPALGAMHGVSIAGGRTTSTVGAVNVTGNALTVSRTLFTRHPMA